MAEEAIVFETREECLQRQVEQRERIALFEADAASKGLDVSYFVSSPAKDTVWNGESTFAFMPNEWFIPQVVLPFPTPERMVELLKLLEVHNLRETFLKADFQTRLDRPRYKGVWHPAAIWFHNSGEYILLTDWIAQNCNDPELPQLLALTGKEYKPYYYPKD